MRGERAIKQRLTEMKKRHERGLSLYAPLNTARPLPKKYRELAGWLCQGWISALRWVLENPDA